MTTLHGKPLGVLIILAPTVHALHKNSFFLQMSQIKDRKEEVKESVQLTRKQLLKDACSKIKSPPSRLVATDYIFCVVMEV